MLCRNPFVRELAFGCGQCLPCRINRRRLWTHRLMLEAAVNPPSCFVTLTYSPETLPAGGSLDPAALTLYLKRLRKACHPRKLRYFAVGEYGDITQRPHYHLMLFGLSPSDVEVISRTWGLGHVAVGECSVQSAGYIAGYVTKKMTKKDDPRLEGRHPEFARMSRRPGIGAAAMKHIVDDLTSDLGSRLLLNTGDVPNDLRHGNKKYPLGRYLKGILRSSLGTPGGFDTPSAKKAKENLSALLGDYAHHPPEIKKMVIMCKTGDQVKALERKFRIRNSKRMKV